MIKPMDKENCMTTRVFLKTDFFALMLFDLFNISIGINDERYNAG